PPGTGKWVNVITERQYYGDIIKTSRRWEEGEYLNGDISIGNSFSIVADAYAFEHFFAMKYISWAGTLWVVSNVTVERPRLVIRPGGVYNGPVPEPSPSP